MFGSVTPTPSGIWFRYPFDDMRLTAYSAEPGVSGFTVLWKGATDIDLLGAFFEHAAGRVQAGPPVDHMVWIVTSEGPRPFEVPHVVPVPPALLSVAQFIRFECRPNTEAGDSPLIVWANLDQEVDPGQESIGVYLRPQDLANLQNDISHIIASTMVSPATEKARVDAIERAVHTTLTHIASDLKEATQHPSP